MNYLYRLITEHPIKVIGLTFVLLLVLVTGVSKMTIATGNETLINSDTKEFQDNLMLEQHFGGETIIILNKSDTRYGGLTPENLDKMKKVHAVLEGNKAVYSVISPVTIVEHMTKKQSAQMLSGLGDAKEGLYQLGNKLVETGSLVEDGARSGLPIDLNALTSSMAQMDTAFDKMISGQEKLSGGILQLNEGYLRFGTNVGEASKNMEEFSKALGQLLTLTGGNKQLEDALNKSIQKSQAMSLQLGQLSEKMVQTSHQTKPLTQIPSKHHRV